MEDTVKRILMVMTMATLLPMCAFAGKKKQQPQPQDGTDWLNAPPPDGSPTLKQTSDWLAKTLEGYGGGYANGITYSISGVRVDNDCSFHYTEKDTGDHYKDIVDVSFPLGAVTSVSSQLSQEDSVHNVTVKTGDVNLVKFSRPKDKDAWREFAFVWVGRMPQEIAGGEARQAPEQMLPHIVSALQHAVDLCKSNYQPPAQSKEPF